jgi:cytochrome c peroxidase
VLVTFYAATLTAANTPTVPAPRSADLAWKLPATPPMPADNASTPDRVALGKALFFDPRLSGSGAVSCASCHNPSLGWADGLKTAIGTGGQVLGRATPTIVNTAFNTQFMWDGRKKSLEDQALGPMKAKDEMDTDFSALFTRLRAMSGYVRLFEQAYPREGITEETIAKALAAFERTVVANDSPFDRWLAGNTGALTPAQWRGYQVFADPAKGNCAACHNGPNFTDNGFHNIGIRSTGQADLGRFNIRAVASMKGAFKTPSLRDIELTAPYFRDGSAATLHDVVEHYVRGGDDRSNLSADMKPLKLSEQEKDDLVAFLRSLTSRHVAVAMPELPR